MSHTPGPWHWKSATNTILGPNPTQSPSDWIEEEIPNTYVALQPGVIDYAGCGSHAIEVSEANARLIAAAPDMLVALKTLQGTNEDTREVWELVNAAIAKAEGRP